MRKKPFKKALFPPHPPGSGPGKNMRIRIRNTDSNAMFPTIPCLIHNFFYVQSPESDVC